MKRVLILCLIAVFLISAAGCARKSDYDKLLAEKASVQKKCNDLSSAKVHRETQLAAKEKEARKLSSELKTTRTKLNGLTK